MIGVFLTSFFPIFKKRNDKILIVAGREKMSCVVTYLHVWYQGLGTQWLVLCFGVVWRISFPRHLQYVKRSETTILIYSSRFPTFSIPDCIRRTFCRMSHLKPGIKHNKVCFLAVYFIDILWLFLFVRNMSTCRSCCTKMFYPVAARKISR